MQALLVAIVSSLVLATPIPPAPDAAAIHTLLEGFLAGASKNDASVHERFWADDLIYTGSSGRRVGKAQILEDVRATPAPAPGDARVTFSAEDVRIQQYDDAALVAFRLVATTVTPESTQVGQYLNSGMFLKRKGRWQVVGWQATKLP